MDRGECAAGVATTPSDEPAAAAQTEPVPDFTGTFEHTLDAKGRVSLPAKIRRCLPSTVKTVLALDKGSVLVFSPRDYKAWVESFFPDGYNPRSQKDVMLQKRLRAFADDADIDSAGRIGISSRLREIVGLERDVTLLGCGDHLEIGDRAKAKALEDELLGMDFMEE